MRGRGKREHPEKTRRPGTSSGTIPTCENSGVNRPGMNPFRLDGRRAVAIVMDFFDWSSGDVRCEDWPEVTRRELRCLSGSRHVPETHVSFPGKFQHVHDAEAKLPGGWLFRHKLHLLQSVHGCSSVSIVKYVVSRVFLTTSENVLRACTCVYNRQHAAVKKPYDETFTRLGSRPNAVTFFPGDYAICGHLYSSGCYLHLSFVNVLSRSTFITDYEKYPRYKYTADHKIKRLHGLRSGTNPYACPQSWLKRSPGHGRSTFGGEESPPPQAEVERVVSHCNVTPRGEYLPWEVLRSHQWRVLRLPSHFECRCDEIQIRSTGKNSRLQYKHYGYRLSNCEETVIVRSVVTADATDSILLTWDSPSTAPLADNMAPWARQSAPDEMGHVIILSTKSAGAGVVERLDCSPPTTANRVQSSPGSLPNFRKWESYSAMPLVGGFSRGFPIVSLISSQDFVAKSHPNLSTQLENDLYVLLYSVMAWRQAIFGNHLKKPGRYPCYNCMSEPRKKQTSNCAEYHPTPNQACFHHRCHDVFSLNMAYVCMYHKPIRAANDDIKMTSLADKMLERSLPIRVPVANETRTLVPRAPCSQSENGYIHIQVNATPYIVDLKIAEVMTNDLYFSTECLGHEISLAPPGQYSCIDGQVCNLLALAVSEHMLLQHGWLAWLQINPVLADVQDNEFLDVAVRGRTQRSQAAARGTVWGKCVDVVTVLARKNLQPLTVSYWLSTNETIRIFSIFKIDGAATRGV
ncbi:hypothetical protein PR048_000009 [Dryococelus australis]|uniref:Uncharacterized protein n=1 Tax=Dryococelus australis TaxID=614101 RepID=A0ABQ9IDE8_9NEOP|nr:hypothetical protein PR048_000009 [Dryococelus australis]